MDYSKKYNYILVGPGASGKTTFYDKQKIRVPKLDKLKDTDHFFTKPRGAFSYCSINYPIETLIERIKGKPVEVVVCHCKRNELERRLTDRLFKRIKKYKNDGHFRQAMGIFARNYLYNYDGLYNSLISSRTTFKIKDTT